MMCMLILMCTNKIYLAGRVVEEGKPMCLNIWGSPNFVMKVVREYYIFLNLNIHLGILSLLAIKSYD